MGAPKRAVVATQSDLQQHQLLCDQEIRCSTTHTSISPRRWAVASIAFLSAMAEEERHRIVKRANEGRVAAFKRGTRFGRKLSDLQQAGGAQAHGT